MKLVSADEGLTQSLGEKMQAVVGRYGLRNCVICGLGVADPLMAGHLGMHEQAERCQICGHAGKLDEHLAHLRAAVKQSEAAQAESFRRDCEVCGRSVAEDAMGTHLKLHSRERVVGEAVKALITAELDGGTLELLARKLYAKQAELAYLFGYGGGQWAEPVAWDDLKARHQAWLVATVSELIKDGTLSAGGGS